MSFTEGPSNPKKKRVESHQYDPPPIMNEILNSFAVLSDGGISEYPRGFRYENNEDIFNPQLNPFIHVPQQVPCHDLPSSSDDVNWSNYPISMQQFPFAKSECLLQPAIGNSPINYFRYLVTDNMLDEIIAYTNAYARNFARQNKTKRRKKNQNKGWKNVTEDDMSHHQPVNQNKTKKQQIYNKDWKETTKDEMLVFLGLLLHMGTIRLQNVKDYWRKDSLFGLRIFADNMNRDRFFKLQRMLRFVKTPEQLPKTETAKDELYEIEAILHLFNVRLSQIYYPGREVHLHELMIFPHGQLIFKQYLQPSQCHKDGFKMHMLATPDGIVFKFMVEDSLSKVHAQKMVFNLLDGMLDVGHSVLMDNNCNSYELTKYLAERRTHCTGSIRKDRKVFPKEVKDKELKKGETVAKYANGVMIGRWQDDSEVTYISNEYKNEIVEKTNKWGKKLPEPLPVIQYNRFLTGVNKQVKILAYYPFERKKIRLPTKLFIQVLQLMISSSHILYNKYCNENMSLQDFRLAVIRFLLKPEPVVCVPVIDPSQAEHFLRVRELKAGDSRTVRKRCVGCYARGKNKQTVYVCTTCEGMPGYCLDCANITHK